MIRNKTSAMPRERIQLSNQRANTERCLGGYGGGWSVGGGDGSRGVVALLPTTEGPKSCMRLMLATQPARRNRYSPSSGLSPLPNSDSEFCHRVVVTYAGREACDPTLPFDPHPGDGRVRQGGKRIALEARTSGREDNED